METLRLNSTGPTTQLLQSTLKELKFYNSAIDGIFGIRTQSSVINYQKVNGLNADGIVGPKTWNSLMPYINGFFTYKIKAGDSFYRLSQDFNTTIDALIFANPQTDYNNLVIDEEIIIPIGSIVQTDISYTSEILELNINSFKQVYPFLEFETIGRTVLRKPITSIKFGKGPKEIFYNAAIHANEWITSPLLMKFLENLCKSYVNKQLIFGTDPEKLFEEFSLYIVPMINLDGVDLVTGLLEPGSFGYNNAQRISFNFPEITFPSGWKANIERK